MRRSLRFVAVFAALLGFALVLFGEIRQAHALPSFSRKYQTSCLTCHTVYPMLNAFGEAFRRDGYRFPSVKGSLDSDAIKSATIALGQEEYIRLFPESVFPAKIMEAVPLSLMLNGALTMNFPDSDAKTAAGNVFTWGGLIGEMHIFAGGAFNDNLTYMSQLTLNTAGEVDIETGYLLWNDIFGPAHMVNLWVGRLMAPQLTSFALHSSYLADSMMPPTSVIGLYNSVSAGANEWAVGQPHADGIEVNGIIGHRLAYSVGWLASTQASAFGFQIDAEDVYAHLGVKTGGIALDGEGKYGPNPPDSRKPWAERSLTLDVFAYRGMSMLDAGTGTATDLAAPAPQKNWVGVVGGAIRAQFDSAILNTGARFEHHDAPYQGTPPDLVGGTPGVASLAHGEAVVGYGELDYVVYPWLVPGVRAELTWMSIDPSDHATLFRLVPGIATLIRPNIRFVLTGDFEWATGMPVAGSWGPAGGSIVAPTAQNSKIEAETVTATMNIAF